MNPSPQDIGFLHFIGIGGIGMSGIALMMDYLGYTVQGSDLNGSKRLQDSGMIVHTGHNAKNIYDKNGDLPSAVVMSSAISDDNPELIEARRMRIPIVRRADMLAELMRFKRTIVIGGTHGKTTTTAITGHILSTANLHPTIINGGILNAYGTNAHMGSGNIMVVESDESDGSFTRLPATVALITNIDPEHMEHYGTIDALHAAFASFIENVPFYGYGVLCTDHPQVKALADRITDRRVITYGFGGSPDWKADIIGSNPNESTFDVTHKSGVRIKNLKFSMTGNHNVQNALGALAIAWEEGVREDDIRKALASFSGVGRRFTRVGEVGGVHIIDDYAHHPIEIRAVLKTARSVVNSVSSKGHNRVIAVMQPHRFTRLRDQFDGFCECFKDCDIAIISDVYTASEKPIKGIDSNALARGIKESGHKDVRRFSDSGDLAPMLSEIIKEGDIVVFMGAGDITKWANDLPKGLANI